MTTTCTTPLNQGRAERGQMVLQESGAASLTSLLTDLAAYAAREGLYFPGAAQAAQARVVDEEGEAALAALRAAGGAA